MRVFSIFMPWSNKNKSCMRVDESWQARVCMRVFSTLMSWASDNKSCELILLRYSPLSRFSWPPWHSSRSRYRYQSERSASPGISSGLRRRSGEDRPRLRRSKSEDFKKYSRRSYRQREDYFSNPYQPDLRRTFRI